MIFVSGIIGHIHGKGFIPLVLQGLLVVVDPFYVGWY